MSISAVKKITSNFQGYLNKIHSALCATEITDRNGEIIDQESALIRLSEYSHEISRKRQTLFFVGNGASATMASHMAADFCKTCGIKGMAFNDIALMTAVSNDIHYEACFALPLARFALAGDLLITISSSGNSPNVIEAIRVARELKMGVVTFSAMQSENKTRRLGDLNFWVPASTYGLAEAAHQTLLHCWQDTYQELFDV